MTECTHNKWEPTAIMAQYKCLDCGALGYKTIKTAIDVENVDTNYSAAWNSLPTVNPVRKRGDLGELVPYTCRYSTVDFHCSQPAVTRHPKQLCKEHEQVFIDKKRKIQLSKDEKWEKAKAHAMERSRIQLELEKKLEKKARR